MRLVLSIAAIVSLLAAQPARAQDPRSLPWDQRFYAISDIDQATGLPLRVQDSASGIRLVLVRAGEFMMGSPSNEPGRGREEVQHRRFIRRAFYLGETEVTVGQFRRFVNMSGYFTDAERGIEENGHGVGAFATTNEGDREWSLDASWRNPFPLLTRDYQLSEDHPVVQVSWNDARSFAAYYGMDLPSEAQWEYAARAGSQARYPWGDAPGAAIGNGNVADAALARRFPLFNDLFQFDDGAVLLSQAARYRGNFWGLHDMLGNVSEWCRDEFQAYPPDNWDESPRFLSGYEPRVLRGGSWLDGPALQRPAKRLAFGQHWRRDYIGFRVMLPAPAR